ncbi:MAG TPA: pyruvate kinase [Vicinamibacteria bacterium]|nr:pyruvate kinase [Vicinamibacteria bacterium]
MASTRPPGTRAPAARRPREAAPRFADAASAHAARRLIPRIEALVRHANELERARSVEIDAVALEERRSARNLVHYLALRQADVRPLQEELSALGLSSLARIESFTLAALESVLTALRALGEVPAPRRRLPVPVDARAGPQLLQSHAVRLLAIPAGKRTCRIMVTLPSEAADERELVEELLVAGMDVARINCAHDSSDDWVAMVRHVRRAEQRLGRSCRIYADLAGPKLRTGALAAAGQVVKLRPRRDLRGGVLAPARLRLVPAEAAEPEAPPGMLTLPVAGGVLARALPGDELHLHDTRGRERQLTLLRHDGAGFLAESEQTAILETGLPLTLVRGSSPLCDGRLGTLPEVVEPLLLATGDRLFLTRGPEPGHGPRREDGRVVEPAQIPCSLDDVFECARAGQPVFFDDGKIGGEIVSATADRLEVRIDHAPAPGAKLRPEKGINLPETELRTPALTPDDRANLEMLAPHVDIVGLSFVRRPEDVVLLERELTRLEAQHLGIVLKMETRRGFESLPRLLLTALQSPPVGVMVARGDLAVEVGFDRMAEVQEEILWLCEAAHVPVIWATQVLETLAKSGSPTRAEVTDAVMSGRAECVMLNKGRYVVEAVRFLSGLLERMEAHRSKQRPRLRRLAVSR